MIRLLRVTWSDGKEDCIPVDADTKAFKALEKLAKSAGKDPGAVVVQAIEEYLDAHEILQERTITHYERTVKRNDRAFRS